MLKEAQAHVQVNVALACWPGLALACWSGCVCAICYAVSCRVISEFIWINRFADATKCPLLAAKRCEACNVRHRHLLWQHVRWWWRQQRRWRLRRRLEQAARQSQILHNIPTGGPGTFGSLSHGGESTQRVAHGAGGALQCHVNKLCSGFSATHIHNINTQPELAKTCSEREREVDLV